MWFLRSTTYSDYEMGIFLELILSIRNWTRGSKWDPSLHWIYGVNQRNSTIPLRKLGFYVLACFLIEYYLFKCWIVIWYQYFHFMMSSWRHDDVIIAKLLEFWCFSLSFALFYSFHVSDRKGKSQILPSFLQNFRSIPASGLN